MRLNLPNSGLKAQSAIEYLMTYGWMLLVVAIVGGAIFSMVGEQSIESVNGFNSQEAEVADFGLTESSLQMNIEAYGANSITLREVQLEDSGQNASILLNEGISPGNNHVLDLPHLRETDGSNTVNIELVYDTGNLENIKTSGTVTGGLELDESVKEIGKITSFEGKSGDWTEINFGREYDNPVVSGVRNSQNGDDGIIVEVKDVDSTSAKVRVCSIKHNPPSDGCRDSEALEEIGVIIVDESKLDSIDGLDAGKFRAEQGIGEDGEVEITLEEDFSSEPHIFASAEIENGPSPVEGRITSVSTSEFEGGICKMDNEDEDQCSSSHPEETVHWIAINHQEAVFNTKSDAGSVYTGSYDWESVEFSQSFNNPIIFAEVQGYSGTQDVIVGESRNTEANGAEVRFCEFDYNGVCDGHNGNDVAWSVFESGYLTVKEE